MKNPEWAWVVVSEGCPDQICYDWQSAKREKKDLKAMGLDPVQLVFCPFHQSDDLFAAIDVWHDGDFGRYKVTKKALASICKKESLCGALI